MPAERYLSTKKFVNGASFANLGIFKGLGDGIISAVYSLVLLDIFHDSAMVGVYSSLYYVFCMLVTLFAGEFFRIMTKTRLFYVSLIAISVMYFMMAFSVKPATFIALDFASGIPLVLAGMLIPLFMSDFSKNMGMAKLSGRYTLWLNAGALFAPMISMFIASRFGVRTPFFAVAAFYMFGLLYFQLFGIIQEDKKTVKISPRKTLKTVWKNTAAYFRRPDLVRAYCVNFGFYALYAMRSLYVPIIVIESGFSKDTLGLVLTLGIIPYVILSEPLGRLARKTGAKLWLAIGFVSFAGFAFWASLASGGTLLAIFVLWQISGAFMEPLRDLLFFDAAKKEEQAKFIGIFKTASNLPRFVAPLAGAGFIMFFGTTGSVWIMTGIIALITTWVLLYAPKKS